MNFKNFRIFLFVEDIESFEVYPLDLCQIYREPQAGIFHPFALNPLEIHVFSWNIPLTFSTEGDAIFLTILDRLEYKG